MKFKNTQTTIDAIQWNGDNAFEIDGPFLNKYDPKRLSCYLSWSGASLCFINRLNNKTIPLTVGDWIVVNNDDNYCYYLDDYTFKKLYKENGEK